MSPSEKITLWSPVSPDLSLGANIPSALSFPHLHKHQKYANQRLHFYESIPRSDTYGQEYVLILKTGLRFQFSGINLRKSCFAV